MSEYVKEVTDASFEQDVIGAGEPVLVDFWAEWCAPCRMIAPTVEALAKEYEGRARVVKLNVDNSPQVAQRYGIKGIPTLILFRDGKEAERIVGAVGKDSLSRLVEKYVGTQVQGSQA